MQFVETQPLKAETEGSPVDLNRQDTGGRQSKTK